MKEVLCCLLRKYRIVMSYSGTSNIQLLTLTKQQFEKQFVNQKLQKSWHRCRETKPFFKICMSSFFAKNQEKKMTYSVDIINRQTDRTTVVFISLS